MPRQCSTSRETARVKVWVPAIFLILGAALRLQAETEAPTNQASISYSSPLLDVENPYPMDVLRAQLIKELAQSQDTVFDRFLGPPSRLSWAREQNALGYQSLEKL